MIELLGMSIIIGGYIMKSVVYFENVSFEIRGEREKEAAEFLKEALTGVAKRKSGYIETQVDAILEEVKRDFEVEITMVVD